MQMLEKKAPLHFEKGLHHGVVSGKFTCSRPGLICSCSRSVQLFSKFVVVSGFSLFIGSRHHYPPVLIPYNALLFG